MAYQVLRHLNLYFARFRPGRQEDAHDALRQLIDTCIRSEALPAKISPSAQNKKVGPLYNHAVTIAPIRLLLYIHRCHRLLCWDKCLAIIPLNVYNVPTVDTCLVPSISIWISVYRSLYYLILTPVLLYHRPYSEMPYHR